MVGIAHGFCFAGNAVLLGCCDVVIATRASNIGMGGPAMIEGGGKAAAFRPFTAKFTLIMAGLGVFSPTEIGPVSELATNGVIDIVADDEAHATTIAKLYLSYFQGRVANFEADDQSALRSAVPLNRSRVFEVRFTFDCGGVCYTAASFDSF
jgi:acetyl-CoA carboxylase carboxyltransferase component